MPSKKSFSDKSYLRVVSEVRKLIMSDYSEMEWLPSVREMCDLLQVSLATYVKAMKYLEEDDIIKSYPTIGYAITPEPFRSKKVGIVIREGADSPFLGNDLILCAILNTLRSRNYSAQIIQGKNIDAILDKAIIRSARGLLWLYPSQQAIRQLQERLVDLPIVFVKQDAPVEEDYKSLTMVTPDLGKEVLLKLNFFLKRRHKKIVYITKGKGPQSGFDRFAKASEGKALKPIFIPHDVNGKNADLSQLAIDSDITATYIDGKAKTIYEVFNIISKLPRHYIRDIYVNASQDLQSVCDKYPNLTVTATSHFDQEKLAETAADIILDHLIHKKILKSKQVDCFTVETQKHS